jgi:hypothetical protein
MLKKAIQWFRSPVFTNDEEKTRKASLLNAVLNTFLLLLPVLFISTMMKGASRPEAAQIIIMTTWLMIFGIRLVMFSGRVVTACIITVTVLYAATTLALLNVGTIRAPATSLYFLVIISAGLILGRRAIIWTTGISGITVLALLLAEQRGMLPLPDMTVHTTQGVTFVVVYTILGVLLYLAVKSIDDAMARAERELAERMLAKEREARRREMMQRVIHIGKTVA